MPIQQSSDLWIETWLSTGRFGTYLSAARGSRPLALALYEWNAHEKTIWVPYLHTAYPFKTDRRKIHQTLYELREFRNRVAHHEPLLVGSEFERRKIISVASRLLPQAAVDHLKLNSEVLTILSERPT